MLAITAILFFVASIAAHYLWYPLFAFPEGTSDLFVAVGIGLCAFGTYVLALSGRAKNDRRRPRSLVVSVCALFFVPGIGLFLGSWIVVTNSIVVLLLGRIPSKTRNLRNPAPSV